MLSKQSLSFTHCHDRVHATGSQCDDICTLLVVPGTRVVHDAPAICRETPCCKTTDDMANMRMSFPRGQGALTSPLT